MEEWHKMPELPTPQELMGKAATMWNIEHIVDKPLESKEDYLETQYRLLRFEGVELLRRSIQSFRLKPNMVETEDTAIYTKVFVQGYTPTRLGTACRLGFSTERAVKRIRWTHTDRLKCGKVVALSPEKDNFRTICMVATVAARRVIGGLMPGEDEHEHTPPRIDIFWANTQDAIINPLMHMVMIESKSGYFEGVRHTLRGLQLQWDTKTRFDKYIINGEKKTVMPKYIKDLGGKIDFSCLCNSQDGNNNVTQEFGEDNGINDENAKSKIGDSWPVSSTKVETQARATSQRLSFVASVDKILPAELQRVTGLDASQLDAVRNMIATELPIVQGPPGTGKTFTSVAFLNTILANTACNQPIVIAAQTNHALDQILRILNQISGVPYVRLGSRSRDEEIKKNTLYQHRKRMGNSAGGRGIGRVDKNLKAYTRAMESILTQLFCNDGEVLRAENLLSAKLLTSQQYNSLATIDWGKTQGLQCVGLLDDWLQDAKVEVSHPLYDLAESDEFEDVEDLNVEDGFAQLDEEDEQDALSGKYIDIKIKWTGRIDKKYANFDLYWKKTALRLETNQDMWKIPKDHRGAVYQLLQRRFIQQKTDEFRQLLRANEGMVQEARVARAKADTHAISELGIRVIGCTTTGLTKFRHLLARVKPKVLLIEEAAETREANITASLLGSLQQLILVGDHMQLVPHIDVPELGEHPYNLKVSLFERLINIGIPKSVLSVQRRMVPEIRELLVSFYPGLSDHPLVRDREHQRPFVPGMGNVTAFFFTHCWPEGVTQGFGRNNKGEANMIANFVKYLLQNGIPHGKITILAFYRAQRTLVRRVLEEKHGILLHTRERDGIRIHTVDGYQGEENDIIILSLVRSPHSGLPNVGFLYDQNRAVVALSRARRGLFMFGNLDNLLHAQAHPKSRALWGRVTQVLERQGRWGDVLPLTCHRHKNITCIGDNVEWEGLQGGCSKMCGFILHCGHTCERICHPDSCDNTVCHKPCTKILTACGHRCREICARQCQCVESETCGPLLEAKRKDAPKRETFEDYLTSHRAVESNTQGKVQIRSNPDSEGNQRHRRTTTDDHLSDGRMTAQEWRYWNPLESDKSIDAQTLAAVQKMRKAQQGLTIKHRFNQVEVGSDMQRRRVATQVDELMILMLKQASASDKDHRQDLPPRDSSTAQGPMSLNFPSELTSTLLTRKSDCLPQPKIEEPRDLLSSLDDIEEVHVPVVHDAKAQATGKKSQGIQKKKEYEAEEEDLIIFD